jgi:hypothetical protein
MRKLLLAIGCFALFQIPAAHALFFDFEVVPGLTATPNPTQGGNLNNNSELNDEAPPLRVTSAASTSSNPDTFGSISGLLNLTGSALGPAHSGTNVVGGLQGGGVGSQATIDFTMFVEVRVLQAGITFFSEWIQLFGDGTTARVTACGDLNCGDQLSSVIVKGSGLFQFTAPAGKEIRNVGAIPIVLPGVAGGLWVDDVTITADGVVTPPPTRGVPEPGTALLVASAIALLGFRKLGKVR